MQEIARVQRTMTILCDPRRKRNPTKFRTISFKVKKSNAVLHDHLSSSLSSSWSSLIINILINIKQHKHLQQCKHYQQSIYNIYIYIYIISTLFYTHETSVITKLSKSTSSVWCQLCQPPPVTRLQQGATNEQLQLVVSKELPCHWTAPGNISGGRLLLYCTEMY